MSAPPAAVDGVGAASAMPVGRLSTGPAPARFGAVAAALLGSTASPGCARSSSMRLPARSSAIGHRLLQRQRQGLAVGAQRRVTDIGLEIVARRLPDRASTARSKRSTIALSSRATSTWGGLALGPVERQAAEIIEQLPAGADRVAGDVLRRRRASHDGQTHSDQAQVAALAKAADSRKTVNIRRR